MATRFKGTYGVCFIIAGLSVALWTLGHPWGTIAGAEVGGSTQWAVSHTFHFLGGFFGSIGLLSLVGRLETAGRLERIGFFVAFIGTVMFTGTGVITAFVWPLLATNAPALVELNGPFFSPPHPIIGVTAVAFSVGYILLFAALARAGVVSKIWAAIVLVGALLLLPPPPPLSPVPWLFFPLGGLLLGLGLITLGLAIRAGRAGVGATPGPAVA